MTKKADPSLQNEQTKSKQKNTPHTYQQIPLYPQASVLFCLPTPKNSHVQCWQKDQHEQTLVFPRKERVERVGERKKKIRGHNLANLQHFRS